MSIEILHPQSREEWLGLRSNTIGASEVPALLGVHPFMSVFELYCLKSGRLQSDPTETGPMRRGRHLEQVAINFLQEERPDWQITANPIPGGVFHRDLEIGASCTPDAFVVDSARPGIGVVQIKSVEPSVFRRTWMADGAIAPPLYATVQAIQEAHLTGSSWCVVAALVVGFGIDMHIIDVPLHAGVIQRIRDEVAHFWTTIARGIAPDPDRTRDGALLERLYDPTVTEIDLSADNELTTILDERERLKAESSSAEKRLKEIKTELLAKLGAAAIGRAADGRLIVTGRIERKAYSAKASSYVDLRVKRDLRTMNGEAR